MVSHSETHHPDVDATEVFAERHRHEVLFLARELAGAEHLREVWPALRAFLLGEAQ